MKKRILIAGGDLRQLYCAARLSGIYDTAVLGFDPAVIPDGLTLETPSPGDAGSFDCAVLPVPPLNANGAVNCPCSEETILPGTVRSLLKSDAFILAGRTGSELAQHFPGHDIGDYMAREELSLKNAIPTAEGAVQIALEELPVTLSGLKVLIVGMGRIGTALCGILKGFGAEVTVAVRSAEGAAKARIAGVRSCMTNSVPADFALVFNTVPAMIFGREQLAKFPDDTLFIDLASKPGGIDFEGAAELGKHVVWALGLPGKTAPVTSGELIAETVMGMIAERGERNE